MLNPKYSLPYGRLLLAWTTRSDAKIVRRNCYYLLPSMKGMGVCHLEVHDRRNKVGGELERYMALRRVGLKWREYSNTQRVRR
jgi:hypothetical protein